MTTTKARARRGPDGAELRRLALARRGAHTEEERRALGAQNEELKMAMKETRKRGKAGVRGQKRLAPEKQALTLSTTSADARLEDFNSDEDAEAADDFNTTTTNPPAVVIPRYLEKDYEIIAMSIGAGTHIQQKVNRIKDFFSTTNPSKPKIVMLHAKAIATNKLITIAEVARRDAGQADGTWFQYNQVEGRIEVQPEAAPIQIKVAPDLEYTDEVNGATGEVFETMKTPFERAIEGSDKFRAVPLMTIYLSRTRIERLKRSYGEQTSAKGSNS